ncbi:MAG: AAA family ATPase [Candidatus Caldarchaeum sp.]
MIERALGLNKALLKSDECETRLWPCFIGRTGVGKSSRAKEISKKFGLPLIRFILSHTLPEDVGGILRVIEKRAEWILPSWAHEPVILFFDEADKAHRECVAAILSIMTSHHIRETRLHDDTLIVVAMQPPEWRADDHETYSALSARLLWIPCSEVMAYEFWVGDYGLKVPEWAKDEGGIEPPFNETPSPRQIKYVVEAWAEDEEFGRWVIDAAIHPKWRKAVASWITSGGSRIGLRSWIKFYTENPELVNDLPVTECVRLAVSLIEHGDEKALAAWGKAIEKIAAHGGKDEVESLCRGMVEAIDRKAGGQTTVEVFGNATPADVKDVLVKAITEGGIIRAKRVMEKQKRGGQ